jgi:hypothetical protein
MHKFKLKTVIIKPLGGLANRIRAIEAACNYSDTYKSKLIIIWERNADLNAVFSDCFKNIPNVKVIDVNYFGVGLVSKIRRKLLWFVEFCYTAYVTSFKVDDDDIKALENKDRDKVFLKNMFDKIAVENKGIFLNLCYNFYPDHLKFRIQINDHIIERGNMILKDVKQLTGVHIRRTDHVDAIVFSPLTLFINAMNAILMESPSMRFYLSTDSETVVDELTDVFKDRILTGVKNRTRTTKAGIEAALVDLYCLSCCKGILGSHNSSFSERAALMSNIPLKIISDKVVNQLSR